jgi:hypothetical protein
LSIVVLFRISHDYININILADRRQNPVTSPRPAFEIPKGDDEMKKREMHKDHVRLNFFLFLFFPPFISLLCDFIFNFS